MITVEPLSVALMLEVVVIATLAFALACGRFCLNLRSTGHQSLEGHIKPLEAT